MRRLSAFVIAAAALVALTSVAFAHAHLVKSLPAGGSTVKVAPGEITLWFTEALEPNFNTVEVVDAQGNRFDDGAPALDASDKKMLHVALKTLPAGRYKATWRVVSVDSHHTEGNFSFKVGS
ncbi:MAG: copper homeostasis periplasmic binding protein CopC [Alphaproteobacteria bacterium]|nr:copper homeostasis periplasmic binding protein CopC [Alphaproteobacteria bacterium]